MSDPMATKAVFVGTKQVRSRNAMQLIFEVPIEQAFSSIQSLGGYPSQAESVWCAIARLNPSSTETTNEPTHTRHHPPD